MGEPEDLSDGAEPTRGSSRMPASEYYALVYLRGCGELIQTGDIKVDESDPEVLTVTVRVLRPDI